LHKGREPRYRKACTLRVLYGDTDAAGVVYYANYLRWFEAGRAEAMRGVGLPYADLVEMPVHLPVIEAKVKYFASARYDDTVAVHVAVPWQKGVRLCFAYRVVREGDGALLAEGETVHAFVDGAGKVVRAPAPYDRIVEAVEKAEG
jgi:acyl-CoA thioester hydrolase